MKTLLIDGDILAYKYALVNQEDFSWSPGDITSVADLGAAQFAIRQCIENWEFELGAEKSVIALSDPKSNWRKSVLKTYKHNRADKKKPLLHGELREYMRSTWKTFEVPTLEGDDVLGILATNNKMVPGEKIVVSLDKDMLTVPCKLFRPHKPEEGLLNIRSGEADYCHMLQTLTGDPTDGYEGCPGVGKKTAERLLDVVEDYEYGESLGGFDPRWFAVLVAYAASKLRGDPVERALQQARVARICRNEDYDFKKKEVRLWYPYPPVPQG